MDDASHHMHMQCVHGLDVNWSIYSRLRKLVALYDNVVFSVQRTHCVERKGTICEKHVARDTRRMLAGYARRMQCMSIFSDAYFCFPLAYALTLRDTQFENTQTRTRTCTSYADASFFMH